MQIVLTVAVDHFLGDNSSGNFSFVHTAWVIYVLGIETLKLFERYFASFK